MKCGFQKNICTFAVIKISQTMEIQTVLIENENIISSGASIDGVSVRRSGMAKVQWRKLNTQIPKSEIIPNGVNLYKD